MAADAFNLHHRAAVTLSSLSSLAAPVVVIGAGAAGISAALWLHDRRVPFRWLEASERIGGTLLRVGNPIDELIGFHAEDGPTLVTQLQAQLTRHALEPRFAHRVLEMIPGEAEVQLVVQTPHTRETWVASAVIVATGTSPRMLGVAGERELLERGVEISVNRRRGSYRDRPVAIIGGGDAALEGALLLAEVTADITLIHRRAEFRAQRRFVDAVRSHPTIRILHDEVRALDASEHPEGPRLRGLHLLSGEYVRADGVFVRLGVAPRFPAGLVEDASACAHRPLPDDGFSRTGIPRVYAAGDVAASWYQSVSWCAGSAARAVATLCVDLGIVSR